MKLSLPGAGVAPPTWAMLQVVARLTGSSEELQAAKAAHLRQLQQANEASDMAECTFTPAIRHSLPPAPKVCVPHAWSCII